MEIKQLPRWKREVEAAKIKSIDEGGELTLEGVDFIVKKEPAWMNKNFPDVGDYYVVDSNKAASVMPAAVFEESHRRIEA